MAPVTNGVWHTASPSHNVINPSETSQMGAQQMYPCSRWVARLGRLITCILPGTDSGRCCLKNEPWSKCFLRLGRGLGGGDCSTMDDQMCTWDNTVSAYLDPSIMPKVRYVVKSIYGVHDFFSSYFKGELSEASTLLLLEGTRSQRRFQQALNST